MNRPWLVSAIGLLLFLVSVVRVSSPQELRASGPQAVEVRLIDPGRVSHAPTTRYYLQARHVDEREVIALRERLISEGAERVNLFVPSMIIVCEAPGTMDVRALVGDPRYVIFEESAVDRETSAAAEGVEDLRFVKMCYERALEPVPAGAAICEQGGFDDMLRLVPPEVVEESKASPHPRALERAAGVAGSPEERNIQQNAEFLVGSILVQLVFPESNGHGEDWTDRMIADATSGAYSAALDYQAKFAYIPMHFTFKTAQRIPTTYEPIATTMEQHALWIRELMTNLNIRDDRSVDLMVHEYNNTWREYYRTQWSFTAFIANSANDGDHRFADPFYTAYAYLGGPHLVIPHPAGEDPFMIGAGLVFSTIFQHEMSHVFWALDEYPGPNNMSNCSSHSGYLDYLNKNKIEELEPGVYTGCPGNPPQLCIMWRAKEDHGRPVCVYTQGQIGVVDANRNSIADVFEAAPSVVFAGADVETVTSSDVTVRMKIVSQAVTNKNPFQAPPDRVNYAPPLKDANVSIDGLGSFYANPDDGKWDQVEEDVSLALAGLSAGLTRVGVVARNAFGKASSRITKSIYYIGIKFALYGAQPENDGTRNVIRVSWKTVGETFDATFDLFRIDTSSGAPDTTRIAVDVEETVESGGVFRHFEFEDASVSPGRSYRYFVKGYFDIDQGGVKTHYEVASSAFDGQSMYPIPAGQIVSQASPNPFRERTQLSVRIPDTTENAGGGGASSSGAAQLVQTPVSVTVFDVAGRVVKTVYDGQLYGGVRTFVWDGTDDDNQRVRSGVYFVKTVAGSGTDVKKVVVIR